MPPPQLQAISSHINALIQGASGLISRTSQLLRRLRDLETEEAKLDAEARQLWDQLMKTDENLARVSQPVSTPVSTRATNNAVDRDAPGTPPLIDPRTLETPVKAFLLVESFALAMSIKSKRRGRIFWTGASTEFGERM